MRKFTYSIPDLLELVKQRPILWDKTYKDYKDAELKETAWKEVYKLLEENYDSVDAEQQRIIGMVITTKWRNIRDAFLRSLKKLSKQVQVRKYLYHDKLTFLLRVMNVDTNIEESSELLTEYSESCFSEEENQFAQKIVDDFTRMSSYHQQVEDSYPETFEKSSYHNKIEDDIPKIKKPLLDSQTEDRSCNKSSCKHKIKNYLAKTEGKKSSKRRAAFDKELLETLKEIASSPSPDEDESFFNSITPSVKTMSEEEKLDFRMGVLELIRTIKKSRLLGHTS